MLEGVHHHHERHATAPKAMSMRRYLVASARSVNSSAISGRAPGGPVTSSYVVGVGEQGDRQKRAALGFKVHERLQIRLDLSPGHEPGPHAVGQNRHVDEATSQERVDQRFASLKAVGRQAARQRLAWLGRAAENCSSPAPSVNATHSTSARSSTKPLSARPQTLCA
jgi:hypothetical protein